MTPAVLRKPRVVIVGAGMSGIATAVALKEAGYDFTILEKGSEVGGVWMWNHYPGLSCDVPSQLYQYSFHIKPDWKRVYATGPQIREYHEEVVDKFGLRPSIRFNTELTEAKFTGTTWQLRTSAGDEMEADFLLMATGLLHHPSTPDIKGLDSFNGTALHSAQWDDSLDLTGKRVAVIGTGSTGVQLVSAFQPIAAQVTQFIRSPQWVVWAPTDLRQPAWLTAIFKRYPDYNKRVYGKLMKNAAILVDITTRPSWRRSLVQTIARWNLLLVRDPELRRKLTPDYQPLCKRQVASGSYYRAVQKPNVEVVTDAIDSVVPEGIVTADAVTREFDVIVFATGFKAHNYMRPMNLIGRDGITIDEAWAQGPRAYRMTAIPGFPNLFTILGPNSPVGSISLQYSAELTARYVIQWLNKFSRGEFDTVEATAAATDEFNAQVKEGLVPTVWATGCNSWYQKEDGTIDLWPFDRATMKRMLTYPDPAHFTIEQSAEIEA
ncbi:MAG: NAD(P)/FAD-dependent oxidoreductase [Thermoleophilaceae bacterium]|nr:NAD(P)/FAD-dependent oxidoreductase [Thermoleophilaceae bacterium]